MWGGQQKKKHPSIPHPPLESAEAGNAKTVFCTFGTQFLTLLTVYFILCSYIDIKKI